MKLLFLCAATALATQDTTPPVMSLSLVTHNGKTHTGVTDHKLNTAFDAAREVCRRGCEWLDNALKGYYKARTPMCLAVRAA